MGAVGGVSGNDAAGRAVYAAGLFSRGSGGAGRGGIDGWVFATAGDLVDHIAAVGSGFGQRFTLRVYDRVERIPLRLHVHHVPLLRHALQLRCSQYLYMYSQFC